MLYTLSTHSYGHDYCTINIDIGIVIIITGDGAGNTVEENSSIFSVIRML